MGLSTVEQQPALLGAALLFYHAPMLANIGPSLMRSLNTCFICGKGWVLAEASSRFGDVALRNVNIRHALGCIEKFISSAPPKSFERASPCDNRQQPGHI